MLEAFENLASVINERAAGHKVIFIPNPGNRGDGLIRYGTKMFLDDFGIAHQELPVFGRIGVMQLLAGIVPQGSWPLILYGGGGGWGHAYPGGYKMVRALGRFTRNVIVLPSTYEFEPQGVSATLFRRDQAESAKHAPNAQFCHDLAFYAAMKRDKLDWYRREATANKGIHFRKDLETRFAGRLPESNHDISATGNHMSNIDDFLRGIADSREIVTDRLHVAVAGLICKRKVTLYEGNYFKIRAIAEATMLPFFGGEMDFRQGEVALSVDTAMSA